MFDLLVYYFKSFGSCKQIHSEFAHLFFREFKQTHKRTNHVTMYRPNCADLNIYLIMSLSQ